MKSTIALEPSVWERKSLSPPIRPDWNYYDEQMKCTVVGSTPRKHPALWREFVAGALASYSNFGVEKALEYDRIVDGTSTSLFFAALDEHGGVRGGLRVQGPYSLPHQTHADLEWSSSRPGRTALRSMVAERLPQGVVEMKTVWTSTSGPKHGPPGHLGAVGASLAAVVFGCRYTLATSAEHAVGPYLDSGAVMAAHIDSVPYPDDRYRTRILWWDQRTISTFASSAKYRQIKFAVDTLVDRPLVSTEAEAS